MVDYDVLIIGAGPIGMACAIEAKKAGLSYVIVEKGALVNSIYNYPVLMTFFSTSQRLEIGDVPFVSINPKPNRNEAVEYYRRVAEKFSLNIHLYERVDSVRKAEDGLFDVQTAKRQYRARYVIVSTGFYDVPLMMNIPGEELPKVTHYYKDPHQYAFQRVVVVGANNSAIDAALETYRKGAQVTLVIRGQEIGSYVKYWVRPDIENRIKEGEINVYYGSTLTSIEPDTVHINTPEGEVVLENDFVIATTGLNFRAIPQTVRSTIRRPWKAVHLAFTLRVWSVAVWTPTSGLLKTRGCMRFRFLTTSSACNPDICNLKLHIKDFS